MDVMRSVLGMVVLLTIAFLLSVNKKKISLRTVGAALVLQVVIGGIMLWLPPGRWVAEKVAFGVHKVMAYSDAGSAFIFGSLVGPKMDTLFDGAGFIFGFRVLPAIIFVTALVSILYYIGVMGILIRILGGIFQKALNISKIESFVAVTTIFLGQNEIPAIVKPFIDRLNRNELFTAICSGMASIAGSTMIGYAALGVPIGYAALGVPVEYLLAASLMAIPGGILFARLLSPATESSQVSFNNLSFTETPPKSIIEAAATGAMTGLKIAAGVATVVMAFVAIIALINGIIGGVGGWFGFAHASLESILGYLLAPLAWVMGVDWSDANLAGSLIGQKLAINEFVAYLNFSPYLQTGGTLDAKTVAIISFALCGFANFGSIGVVVGAFSAVAPHRAPEIAQLGLRALAAATLSNLMSATIAGFFIGLA
ncbi:NupC/NupG family nucleoside CNT transporter [Escherichia coli]|nr:NupC/NupG family nucleoside CNT transporter [Escherichia coli]